MSHGEGIGDAGEVSNTCEIGGSCHECTWVDGVNTGCLQCKGKQALLKDECVSSDACATASGKVIGGGTFGRLCRASGPRE